MIPRRRHLHHVAFRIEAVAVCQAPELRLSLTRVHLVLPVIQYELAASYLLNRTGTGILSLAATAR